MAIVLLASASIFHALYLWNIIPSLAAGFIKYGMTFWLPIRIGIALSNFLIDYSLIVLPLMVLGFIYAAFYWRPEKTLGPNLILSAAIFYAAYVMYLFFMTHLMVVQELLPRMASNP